MNESLGAATLSLHVETGGFEADLAFARNKALNTLERMGRDARLAGLVVSAAITAPIVGMATLAIQSSTQFQTAFIGVTKTVEGTAIQYANLRKEILQMAREVPTAAKDIADIAMVGGQLGIPIANLKEFTRVAIDLGSATTLTAEQAITGITRFMNIMGTAPSRVRELADILVELGNNGASSEKQILDFSLRMAGASHVLGLSEAQIMGFANGLASLGGNAEASGSAFSRMSLEIFKAITTDKAELDNFAGIAGVLPKTFADMVRENPANAILAFVRGLKSASDNGKDVIALLKSVGITQIRVLPEILKWASGYATVAGSVQLATNKTQTNGASVNEATKRYASFASQFALVKQRAQELAITVGDDLVPAFLTLLHFFEPLLNNAQSFAVIFSNLPGPIKFVAEALVGVVAALGPLLFLMGSFAAVISPFQAGLAVLNGSAKAARLEAEAATVAKTAAREQRVVALQAQREQRAAATAATAAQREQQAAQQVPLQAAMQQRAVVRAARLQAEADLAKQKLVTQPNQLQILDNRVNTLATRRAGIGNAIQARIEAAAIARTREETAHALTLEAQAKAEDAQNRIMVPTRGGPSTLDATTGRYRSVATGQFLPPPSQAVIERRTIAAGAAEANAQRVAQTELSAIGVRQAAEERLVQGRRTNANLIAQEEQAIDNARLARETQRIDVIKAQELQANADIAKARITVVPSAATTGPVLTNVETAAINNNTLAQEENNTARIAAYDLYVTKRTALAAEIPLEVADAAATQAEATAAAEDAVARGAESIGILASTRAIAANTLAGIANIAVGLGKMLMANLPLLALTAAAWWWMSSSIDAATKATERQARIDAVVDSHNKEAALQQVIATENALKIAQQDLDKANAVKNVPKPLFETGVMSFAASDAAQFGQMLPDDTHIGELETKLQAAKDKAAEARVAYDALSESEKQIAIKAKEAADAQAELNGELLPGGVTNGTEWIDAIVDQIDKIGLKAGEAAIAIQLLKRSVQPEQFGTGIIPPSLRGLTQDQINEALGGLTPEDAGKVQAGMGDVSYLPFDLTAQRAAAQKKLIDVTKELVAQKKSQIELQNNAEYQAAKAELDNLDAIINGTVKLTEAEKALEDFRKSREAENIKAAIVDVPGITGLAKQLDKLNPKDKEGNRKPLGIAQQDQVNKIKDQFFTDIVSPFLKAHDILPELGRSMFDAFLKELEDGKQKLKDKSQGISGYLADLYGHANAMAIEAARKSGVAPTGLYGTLPKAPVQVAGMSQLPDWVKALQGTPAGGVPAYAGGGFTRATHFLGNERGAELFVNPTGAPIGILNASATKKLRGRIRGFAEGSGGIWNNKNRVQPDSLPSDLPDLGGLGEITGGNWRKTGGDYDAGFQFGVLGVPSSRERGDMTPQYRRGWNDGMRHFWYEHHNLSDEPNGPPELNYFGNIGDSLSRDRATFIGLPGEPWPPPNPTAIPPYAQGTTNLSSILGFSNLEAPLLPTDLKYSNPIATASVASTGTMNKTVNYTGPTINVSGEPSPAAQKTVDNALAQDAQTFQAATQGVG